MTVDVAEARRRLAAGESARAIARDLNVAASTVTRAVAREASRSVEHDDASQRPAPAPSPPSAPSGPASGPATPSGHDRRPRPLIGARAAPEAPPRPVPRPVLGPPDDERSARLWHCPRCGLAGFDPNRGPARAWHDQTVCDEKLARLDRALDDRPRPVDLMTVQW